jgi:hypothetical protein
MRRGARSEQGGTTLKLAVAVVHGIGRQEADFADGLEAELHRFFARELGIDVETAREELIIEPVHWDPVLRGLQSDLTERVNKTEPLDYSILREFLVDFAGDAIAYQPSPNGRKIYTEVHGVFAQSLRRLADRSGPDAPLCVIAHSLGSIIGSNFLYDLQSESTHPVMPSAVRSSMGDSPLEKGDTLALFYTLGSPLAIWSLRYRDFGVPIRVPAPQLAEVHPDLVELGEWVNYYDKDDVIGYPLKDLNDSYGAVVTADVQVNVGNILTSWNPMSHMGYWTDNDVTRPVARSLARLWRAANPISET